MTRGATTQTRTFVYNANHQLQSATNPETGTVTYTYNPGGTVATKTDAKNQVTGYTYDAYKRVTKITRAGNACQTIDYWYDANPHDGSWSVNTWGRVSAVQYGGQSCQGGLFQEFYKYTAAGLPTAKKLRFWRNNSWYELASAHGYDNEGKNTSITYPGHYVFDTELGDVWRDGPTYTYTFDAMARPTKLTQGGGNPIDWAKDVTYNAAGQITQIKYPRAYNWAAYLVETRSYNNRMEMTRLTVAGQADWEYRFSASQNNGQITQMKDWVTGEEVTYQYDALKRLISAVTTGPEWGLSFSYDGFGNKTGQNVTKGSAPVMNLTYHEATNRINSVHGFAYDANGNVTAMPSMTNTYDAANRLTQVMHNSTGTQQYGYAPDNKRVWHNDAQGNESFHYYDVSGRRLGSYRINTYNHITISYTHPSVAATNVYFGSKLIVSEGLTVVLDRLGSVRLREPAGCCGLFARVNYFPYGEGMTSAARNFATYERSASTGVDYADQRYYSGIHGRFLTADPYQSPRRLQEPSGWNRYAYVVGDPANLFDPEGLDYTLADKRDFDPRHPGNVTSGHTSITVTDSSPWVPSQILGYSDYQNPWWYEEQNVRENNCTTADGRNCWEVDRERREQERLRDECITTKTNEIQQKREEFIDARDDRILSGMGRSSVIGAILWAIRGAYGGMSAGGVGGGPPGALLGGLVGGVIGAGASFIRSPVEQALHLAFYDSFTVLPALARIDSDCKEELKIP